MRCVGMQIFATTVVLFLAAGRWGLAPTANKQATAGLKLQQTNRSGQFTGDPAGVCASMHVCVVGWEGALSCKRVLRETAS